MSRHSIQARNMAQSIANDEARFGAMYDRRVHEWDDTPLKAASTNTGAPTGISDPTAAAALSKHRAVTIDRPQALRNFIAAADRLQTANRWLQTATHDPTVELICDNTACLEPVFVLSSEIGPAKAKPLCDGCSMSIKRSGQLPGPDQISERTRKRNQRKGKQQ
jgi:hypothetical protein